MAHGHGSRGEAVRRLIRRLSLKVARLHLVAQRSLLCILIALAAQSHLDSAESPRIEDGRTVRVLSQGSRGLTECLGFVYETDWVVTAGHCVYEGDVVEIVDLSRRRASQRRTVVREFVRHPVLDVCLLNALELGSFPRIAIAPLGEGVLTVSALDRRRSVGVLRRGAAVPYYVSTQKVRARSGVRPCRGDSGGPLVARHSSLIGVLSRGSISCDGRDEYVLLHPISRWLEEVTEHRRSPAEPRSLESEPLKAVEM